MSTDKYGEPTDYKTHLEHFQSGFVACQYSLNFAPATNDGDYSEAFWEGFKTAKRIKESFIVHPNVDVG